MKRITKMTIVIAFMFIAAISTAKEPKSVLTAYSEAKMLVLELENFSATTFIEFKDAQENVIYSEKVSELLYSKKFNLKNLKNGVYSFKTENELKSTIYSIRIVGNEVTILSRKEVNKPFFRKLEERILLNLLNTEKGDVVLTVYGENNRLIFSETIKEKLVIEKAFNFSGAFKGSYIVSVKANGKSYKENFIVD